MAGVELHFTSDQDGSCCTAPIPRDAFTAPVERALLQTAGRHGEGETLRARVEPAFLDGGDEVIAFAVVGDDGAVIGTIPRTAYTLAGAAADAWERHLARTGREPTETATYVMRRAESVAAARAAPGVRVMRVPSGSLEYAFTVPTVRPLDLRRAVAVGTTGAGVVERVFDAGVFDELRHRLLGDLEREQMATLHGRLWFTPNDKGDLVAYVLYEDFVPLEGDATVCSVHIEATAQGASAGHDLPVAALIHSHPLMRGRGEEDAREGGADNEEGAGWGSTALSAVDMVQFRRALPHCHQATIVAALPGDPDGIIRLAPYGYGAGGAIQAESGFWLAVTGGRRRVHGSEGLVAHGR